MGTLLHTCVEVHESIELSFGVVSVVSPGIGVLDGSRHAARGRGEGELLGGFEKFFPHSFQWCFIK